ncbi:hypothetical protein OC25_11100 [Pedobacter kyungheensis]|uniref:Uncharacterized protein n=1 Tax=Pedobacter kyungheensis TaxID=1069985 RepID=A0A0C1FPZ3_9SPHI|nr:hypothetical protein OC25_11100 [Pedobacter kyungheensis]
MPSPSERVAKVEKINTHAKAFGCFIGRFMLNNWFTAENNIHRDKTIGGLGCYVGIFKRRPAVFSPLRGKGN